MIGVEKEISEAASKVDLMRRSLYNSLSSCNTMDIALSEAHWLEFKQLFRELKEITEITERKYNNLKNIT